MKDKFGTNISPTIAGFLSSIKVESDYQCSFKLSIRLSSDDLYDDDTVYTSQILKKTRTSETYQLNADFIIEQLANLKTNSHLRIVAKEKNQHKTSALFIFPLNQFKIEKPGFFDQYQLELLPTRYISRSNSLKVSAYIQLFDSDYRIVEYNGQFKLPGLSFYYSDRIRIVLRNSSTYYVDIVSGGISKELPNVESGASILRIDRNNKWNYRTRENIDDIQVGIHDMNCNESLYELNFKQPSRLLPKNLRVMKMNGLLVFEDKESGYRTTRKYLNFLRFQNRKINIDETGNWVIFKYCNNQRGEIASKKDQDVAQKNELFHELNGSSLALPIGWKAYQNKSRSITYYVHLKSNSKMTRMPVISNPWQVRFTEDHRRKYWNVFSGELVDNCDAIDEIKKAFGEVIDDIEDFDANNNDRSEVNQYIATLYTQLNIEGNQSYRKKFKPLREFIELNNDTKKRTKYSVWRDAVFESKCDSLNQQSPESFKTHFMIQYTNENGLDYGALLSKYAYDFSEDFFKQENKVFVPISLQSDLLMINLGNFQEKYLRAFGKLLALCINQQIQIKFGLSPIFFLNLVGRKIKLSHIKECDAGFYENILFLKQNSINDMNLGLYFTSENTIPTAGNNDQTEQIELIENGSNIEVNDDNKMQYLRLLIDWNYCGAYQRHFDVIRDELSKSVPIELLSMLKTQDLERVFCGLNVIDIDDWEENTVYYGGYTAYSITVHHFWTFLRTLTPDLLAKMKNFATGTSSVPAGGFAQLKSQGKKMNFSLYRKPIVSSLKEAPLPKSHACFNQLELPDYMNYAILAKKLLTAATETDTFEIK